MNDEPEDSGNSEEGTEGAEQANAGAVAANASESENSGNGDVALDDGAEGEIEGQRTAQDLEAVFDVPVSISAVLGRTHMEVSELLRLESGDVIELDRKVGEAIDIYVNNRLIARGEVVLVDEKLGITMTEIIKTERH